MLLVAAGAGRAMILVAAVNHITGLVAPETVWSGGTVKRGSIVETSNGYRFTIHHEWGSTARPHAVVDVFYDGVMPDTVCDGAAVALEGWIVDGHFEAKNVIGFNNGRYSACWEFRCLPEAKRPSRCQQQPWSVRYE